jgi:1-deoxy-D-xylulose-5-phosphate reductoisomerase
MKKIGIIGSTGSIGKQCIDVIEENKDDFHYVFLSSYGLTTGILEQIKNLQPDFAIITGEKKEPEYMGKTKILTGTNNLIKIIENENIDFIVSSAVGFAGIKPTLSAVQSGIDVGLANKESIVSGGLLILKEAEKRNVKIIPIDSEHSAIYQCLKGNNHKFVRRVILTASGGSFRNRPVDSLEYVSLEETLKHPNWNMGSKVTIDSATMMNKGLELIEAKYLFDLKPEQLEVVIHPQSIIHSMVEFIDSSILAQMGYPDMKIPISYALGYPERINSGSDFFDFTKNISLTFMKPDMLKYPCLQIALNVLRENKNSLFIAMNAANEIAVDCFLKGIIKFIDIPVVIEKALEFFEPKNILNIDEIFELDKFARIRANKIIEKTI